MNNKWEQLQDAARGAMAAENRLVLARQDFFSEQVPVDERVTILRHELIEGDRFTALKVMSHLSLEEVKQLFPTLVWLTFSHHSDTISVFKLILSLPHEWIVNTLGDAVKEQYAEDEHAEPGDKYTGYATIMDILKEKDYQAALDLAEKAIGDPDAELQRAAAEFLASNKSHPEN